MYALSYGEGLFHWSVLVERSGRVGVDGKVALAAGGGMTVDAGDEWLVLGDEVVDFEVVETEVEVEVVEVLACEAGVLVGKSEVGGVESCTSPRRHVETDVDEVN